MTANVLVNLLLELNVLNVGDIDTELRKLAAYTEDPRAQKWLTRVARHFIVNIDQLLKQPYRAKAEPRGHYGSKYYVKPTSRIPAEVSRKYGMAPVEFDPKQAPAPPPSEVKWWGEQPMAGDPNACHTCGGSGYVREIEHAETGEPVPTAWTAHDPEETRRPCPACKGTGKRKYPKARGREGFFSESRALFEIERKSRPPEMIEPDPPGVYTSRLHEPPIQLHIEPEFPALSNGKST